MAQSPLGLEWEKIHRVYHTPENFKYYSGDVAYGELAFVGTDRFLGAETELQIFFLKNKISRAILILGPSGVDTCDCLKKYRSIVKFLTKKYGPYRHKNLIKDPIISELVYVSSCYPIKLGMMSLETIWLTNKFKISSNLIGDDEGVYIEIEYSVLLRSGEESKVNTRKVLKRL